MMIDTCDITRPHCHPAQIILNEVRDLARSSPRHPSFRDFGGESADLEVSDDCVQASAMKKEAARHIG
jgi:hypothetical protein